MDNEQSNDEVANTPSQAELAKESREQTAALVSQKWLGLGIVVCILAAALVLWPKSDQPEGAFAIVARCHEVAKETVPRHYTISIKKRLPSGEVTRTGMDLFVDGGDRYALRMPSLGPRRALWFGRNGDTYWTKTADGTQTSSERRVLEEWLVRREQFEVELLATIFNRLSKDYELTSFEDQVLPDPMHPERETDYKWVRGVLSDKSLPIPAQIDVWADSETGIARKIILDSQLPGGQIGVMSKTIELVGEPELPADWFDAEGH